MLGPLAYQIGHGQPDGPWFDEPRPVLSACAAAAAYRRSMLDEIGGFDERFVSYLEDVDLGLRAQYAGYPCLYVPDAVVYHMVSATARRMGETKLRLLLRNSLILFFQYMPPRTVALWGIVMLGWPLVYAVRERQPVRIAAQAIAAFMRSHRVISDAALRQLLSPPFGTAATPAPDRRVFS
jgi:GT2 family glycosyltransferase